MRSLLFFLLLTSFSAFSKTKYPIVLAHGLAASSKAFSFQPVARVLRAEGHEVFVTEVSAFNTIEYRGGQLASQIDSILRAAHAEKVNVIAHSMGGLDSRFVISSLHYEDKIASLSTVGTPHRGSSVASDVLKSVDGLPFNGFLLARLVGGIASLYNSSDYIRRKDILAALHDLTVDHMVENFNPKNLDSAEVFYQSWAGETSLTGTQDQVNPVLKKSFLLLSELEGPNDGQVSISSATWGNFRGRIPADHMDEIGLMKFSSSSEFDYLAFYQQIAEDLEASGY